LIAVGLAILGWALADEKSGARFGPRQALLALLLGYCYVTTLNADFPVEAAEKWAWVSKSLAFAVFLPLTLRTRLRIEALLAFMVLSAASIIIVGGVKTVFSGGGYGELNLMVSSNSGIYEGSTISTVAISIVPVILWLGKFGTIFPPDWRSKLFCAALIFACLLIPVGTSTRTGLLCIGVLALLTLRDVKKRMTYLGLIAAAGLLAIPFLPATFTERMGTIKTYQADESASTRLAVWRWTLDYVEDRPLGGGFDAYRGNRFQYDIVKVEGQGTSSVVTRTKTVDGGRAYHSAYFELLGEQGYPGLIIWLLINLGGLFRMEVLRRRYKDAGPDAAWVAPLASALQHGHLIYLFGSAFIAIAYQPFLYMLIGAQIGLDGWAARQRKSQQWRPIVPRLATT
jgi:probable O-glycosylation ligase (exosortase A-associated)